MKFISYLKGTIIMAVLTSMVLFVYFSYYAFQKADQIINIVIESGYYE